MDTDSEVDPGIRRAMFEQVRHHTGIFMAEKKWTMLQGRLRRRLHALEMDSYRDYLAMLETHPDEVVHFIDLVTTNETSFFRTRRVWDYLEQRFLPEWSDTHSGATLQVWSAAASTGEEAYSVAMLCEEFRKKHPAFKYRIVATDISERVLAEARSGTYRGRNIEGMLLTRPALLEKYFEERDGAFTVLPAVRGNVTFRRHHLYTRLDETVPIDLALLRNVLIYFDAKGQQAVLDNVRRAMAPSGTLIIGESESLGHLRTDFVFEQPLIYRNAVSHA